MSTFRLVLRAAGTPQLRGTFPVYRTYPGHSGKVSMTEKNSGPQEGVKGVVEDVKGKAKEAVGTVTGRDDMVREGKAQQDKADALTSRRRKPRRNRLAPAPRPPKSARKPTSKRTKKGPALIPVTSDRNWLCRPGWGQG